MDCFLYKTKAKLQLLTEWDKLALFEQNLRGGVSFINERHTRAGFSKKLQKHVVLLYLGKSSLYLQHLSIFIYSMIIPLQMKITYT